MGKSNETNNNGVSSSATKGEITERISGDFIPLSIDEYDEDDEITIEDEDYIYELDVIDNHYSNMEHHLAVQQKRRIRRRRCIICSFFFVALLVAIVPSSLVTLRSLIRSNNDGASEPSSMDDYPSNATSTTSTAAAAIPQEETAQEVEAIKVKPPSSRPGSIGDGSSSNTVTSQEQSISTTDIQTDVVECAEGEICFQVLGTIPHDTTSFT